MERIWKKKITCCYFKIQSKEGRVDCKRGTDFLKQDGYDDHDTSVSSFSLKEQAQTLRTLDVYKHLSSTVFSTLVVVLKMKGEEVVGAGDKASAKKNKRKKRVKTRSSVVIYKMGGIINFARINTVAKKKEKKRRLKQNSFLSCVCHSTRTHDDYDDDGHS